MEQSKYTSEEFFTKFSSLILEYITNYNKEILNPIRDKNEYIEEPKKFFYTIIQKTLCSLEAANILIRNFESKRNLHTPLFIVLRSILADIIVAEYIIIQGKNETEQSEIIERIYFDHYDNTLTTTQKTARNVYKWENTELEKHISIIKENERFYNKDGTNKIKALKTSPNTLINKIFTENKNTESLKILKLSFDLYNSFSKLEHIGGLTFHLIHRGYEYPKDMVIFEDLYYSIRVIINALSNYSKLWENEIDINSNYFSNLINDISSMTSEKINCA